MTTIARTAAPTAPRHSDPGFGATVASEWTKLRTAKAPRRNLILGTVLGIGLSLLLSAIVAATWDEWSVRDQADFDPILYPLSGTLLVAIFYVAATVGIVTNEYSSGMIRLTLTVTPSRGRVLAAKALVASLAVTVAGAVAYGSMLLISQLIFEGSDLPGVSLTDGELWRTFGLLLATGPVWPIIGVAVAFLVRSAAGAVSIVLAMVFAPSMFGGLLPDWWQRNVLSLLPGPASDRLAIGHLNESVLHLEHPLAAVAAVVAWCAGLLVLAHWVLVRRDA